MALVLGSENVAKAREQSEPERGGRLGGVWRFMLSHMTRNPKEERE